MKIQFKKAAQRDAQAVKFFGSDAFLGIMRNAVEDAIAQRGRSFAFVFPDYKVKPQDMPTIEKHLETLRKEYPDLTLDHVRRNKGGIESMSSLLTLGMNLAWKEQLVIDTKAVNKRRRLLTGCGIF